MGLFDVNIEGEMDDEELIEKFGPNVNLDDPTASRANFRRGDEIKGGSNVANLKRAVDEEAGVVIYAIKAGSAYSISTVPIKDTKLGVDEDSDADEK